MRAGSSRHRCSRSDKGKKELAKDVAALADHRGGVLVLGMAEAKGVPSRVFDVDLNDYDLRRMREVIATNSSPPVPYEPIHVPNPDAAGTGFLLLAVPRSPQSRPIGSPKRWWPPPTEPGTQRQSRAMSD
ncbi:AlbA family DNA-binding domain-containing protein [Streptomyces sp. NPDC004685]